jgi:hypothetical protein
MSYDNLSNVFQNVLKFYQQLTGEERRVPFIFDRNNQKNPIFRHIKSNNSGTAKVKIVKNEKDPPLFTGKLLIKFQNILRNTTLVIIRHRVKILFSVISSPITLERRFHHVRPSVCRQILCHTIT